MTVFVLILNYAAPSTPVSRPEPSGVRSGSQLAMGRRASCRKCAVIMHVEISEKIEDGRRKTLQKDQYHRYV